MQVLLLSGWFLLGQVAIEGAAPLGKAAPLGPAGPAPAGAVLDDDPSVAPAGDRFGPPGDAAKPPATSPSGAASATPAAATSPGTDNSGQRSGSTDPRSSAPRVALPSSTSSAASGAPSTPRWRDKNGAATPAQTATDLVPVRRSQVTAQTKAVVRRALAAGDGANDLAGHPLTLLEAFRSAGHPAARTEVAKAYWALATAAGRYYRTVDDRRRLEQFASRVPQNDDVQQALIDAAIAAAEARRRQARLEAVAAQNDLAELIGGGGPGDSSLPLATDLPHTGAYRTSFEAIFGLRPAPTEARKLHHLLPLRRAALAARADAVVAAEQAVAAVQAEYVAGREPLASVLDQQRRWMAHAGALLEQVRLYNGEIAQYVSMAGGQGASNESLVTMLIDVPVSEPIPAPQRGELTTALPPASDPARRGQPTLADPPRSGEPTLADPPPENAGAPNP